MANEESEGTRDQKPTSKRLRDAREKGKVSQSRELTGAVALAVGLPLVAILMPGVYAGLDGLYRGVEAVVMAPAPTAIEAMILAAGTSVAGTVILFALVVAAVAVLVSRLQTGAVFSFEPVKPKLDRVNPATNAKQIFSMRSVLMVLLMVLKTIIVGVGIALIFSAYLGDAVRMVLGGLGAGLTVFQHASVALAVWAVISFLLVAGIDFAFQRYFYTKSMKMSRREIKREIREDQGDPIIKSARRQATNEPSAANQLDLVARADVVIEGEGKVVVLIHRSQLNPKPVVIMRAAGGPGQKALAAANAAGVPLVRSIGLTRRVWPVARPSFPLPDPVAGEVLRLLRA